MSWKRARVLVVDDEAANRKLLGDLVEREGYESILIGGGAEALEFLAKEEVDLVLLDLMMPVVDGLEVLKVLDARGALPNLPVVVVTALEDRNVRISALSAGATDFLTKPIDRVEVACRIRTLIELKRHRDKAIEDKTETDHLFSLRFEQSPTAQISWDTEFRVTDWNPRAEELFGYSREEALGKHVSFIMPESPKEHLDRIWGVSRGKITSATNENVTKDGQTVMCQWHNAPLISTRGNQLGVYSVVVDVTERLRMEEELNQSRKMEAFGQLAGGVAHDFNNILAAILAYSGFVRDGLEESDPLRGDVLEIIGSANRAKDLIRQLLTFSRNQPVEARPVDLNLSLIQIAKMLRRTLGSGVEIVVKPAPSPAIVRIDPTQFDQIVLNLAVNARDAMPEGGVITFELSHVDSPLGGRQLRISASDTGEGMSPDIQKRIFEPFFTTKDPGKGTGLGLATCFGIIAKANGRVSVTSKLGEGTTFSIEFPALVEEPVVAPLSDEGAMPTGDGEMVLVVEDEPALRRVAERVLREAGYVVHLASDGLEAKQVLDELGPKLSAILTDVIMPGFNGHEVAQHAALVAPGAAIIMTSGYFEEATNGSNHPIVWKPVAPRDLVRIIASAITEVRQNRTPPTDSAHKVLVVDDDPLIRSTTARLLQLKRFAAREASTGFEALQILSRDQTFSAVISDLLMPGMDGMELCSEIRRLHPSIMLILVSGDVNDTNREQLLESGAKAVLQKPYTFTELVQVLMPT